MFLLYSGMITDPLIFLTSPRTILIAAAITARLFRYTRAEFWTAYGLSHAQAAVTIPTLVIGLETGLFDTNLFNAAILMILLTSITSPLVVQRFAPQLRQSVIGSVLDEVIWGSDTPVMIGKLEQPLNGMQRVLLILPAKVLAPNSVRRMIEANLSIARALNVPMQILEHASYAGQSAEILEKLGNEHPCQVERMNGNFNPNELEKHAASDLLVVPGFGSRQRFLSSLGDLPERLAASFSGNLLILHFDR